MLLREADWAYALVIVWAYLGIAANQTATAAVWSGLLGAVTVAMLIVWAVILRSDRRVANERTALR
jgi:hypothetical protein